MFTCKARCMEAWDREAAAVRPAPWRGESGRKCEGFGSHGKANNGARSTNSLRHSAPITGRTDDWRAGAAAGGDYPNGWPAPFTRPLRGGLAANSPPLMLGASIQGIRCRDFALIAKPRRGHANMMRRTGLFWA